MLENDKVIVWDYVWRPHEPTPMHFHDKDTLVVFEETGALQSFDKRFERMIAWEARRRPEATRAELEASTLTYMATLPAWRDHPRVLVLQALENVHLLEQHLEPAAGEPWRDHALPDTVD